MFLFCLKDIDETWQTDKIDRDELDELIAKWLKTNYKRIDDKDKAIQTLHLYEQIQTYSSTLDEKLLGKVRMGKIISQVFGDVPFIRKPGPNGLLLNFYGLKKRKSSVKNTSVDGVVS